MIKKLVSIAALALPLMLGACGGEAPVREVRQENADNIFGDAKNALIAAQIIVGIYNLAPECDKPGSLQPPFCYSARVATAANEAIVIAAETVEAAERVFAEANSEADARMARAKAARAAVAELAKALTKYGIKRG